MERHPRRKRIWERSWRRGHRELFTTEHSKRCFEPHQLLAARGVGAQARVQEGRAVGAAVRLGQAKVDDPDLSVGLNEVVAVQEVVVDDAH